MWQPWIIAPSADHRVIVDDQADVEPGPFGKEILIFELAGMLRLPAVTA